MLKDYAKRSYSKRPQSFFRIVIVVMMFASGLGGLFAYLRVTHQTMGQYLHALQSPRRVAIPPAVLSDSQKRSENIPDVQFEFYSTLASTPLASNRVSEPPIVRERHPDLPNNHRLKVTERPPKELQGSAKHLHYLLDLGELPSQSAANGLQRALKEIGFAVTCVPRRQGQHMIYRLQAGPFRSIQQTRLFQAHLKKRGIDSHLLSLQEY